MLTFVLVVLVILLVTVVPTMIAARRHRAGAVRPSLGRLGRARQRQAVVILRAVAGSTLAHSVGSGSGGSCDCAQDDTRSGLRGQSRLVRGATHCRLAIAHVLLD